MTKKQKKQLNPYVRFTSIAIQMGLTIYLGNLLGEWLDEKYNTTYWETSISLLAVFIAIYSVIKQVINFTNKQK
ncbi:putative F0F1-ATPase subunit (Ca2+/Mg2+ transporter) [Lacinutrix venerupis]|uniref:AtpZ/AtpI family protein n=1 Tax=Lacinutrix venerupis TaxID=1486034 RepID=UPI000F0D1DA6|nr:AtpZ/AtpI family protein [Lacinutrix venerupis]RLJ63261.1 putative F0F1-ATPase subunit (Ca2+/Mg2+ transporter) [Lacinutrix venerupis]